MPTPVGPQTATISPGVDLEIDAPEHLAAGRVAEVHVVEADRERAVRERDGSAALGERLDAVEPREAARGRRGRPLAEVDDPAERLERPDELQEQRHEERELADREVPCDRLAAPDEQHRGDAERGEEDEPGEKATLDRRLPHRLVSHRVRAVPEAVANVVLATERLHHLDPDDGLVRRLGEMSLLALDLAGDREHSMREEVGENGDRRHGDGRRQREPRVHDREHDRGAHEHEHALDRLHDAPADEVAHRVDVVRRARDHLARRVAVVERPRIRQVGAVEHRAQPRLDPDPDPRRRVPAREVDAEAEHRDEGDRDEVRHEERAVVTVDRVVDRALDEDRDRERQQREDERAREPDRGEPPLRPPEREEVPNRRPEREVGRIDVLHDGLESSPWARGFDESPRACGAETSDGRAGRAGRPKPRRAPTVLRAVDRTPDALAAG